MNITGIAAIPMVTAALGFAVPYAFAADQSQPALVMDAKVTEAQAKATALKEVPHGIVKTFQLGNDHGQLIWSLDVAKPRGKGMTKVNVDAKTGKIASVQKEPAAKGVKEVKTHT